MGEVHTNVETMGSCAYLELGDGFFPPQDGCLGFFDCPFQPFRQSLGIPCHGHGQEFGSKLLAAVTAIVTGGHEYVTRTNVFRLECSLQTEGGGDVNIGHSRCGFAIQPKRNERRRNRSREGECVIREEGESHGSRKDGNVSVLVRTYA